MVVTLIGFYCKVRYKSTLNKGNIKIKNSGVYRLGLMTTCVRVGFWLSRFLGQR